ncbi:cupredoxin domain-containing protein [Photobacterium kishitanii]|uniref:Cupredoxin domain-containing protein n=1 Tax=Photobacterium kishitanii TaxID=318456 RepID=A0A2T3KK30_9GAMM|nr:cupredoxin domain-containing protein [Photobacterium kishitanii]PSU85928.1 cupredoxin domain-containing protein [Photobacterium kishitanii]PSU90408.1 cupredoxin domain-containing protein [Photobacterium kishitanii]PSU99935.1 cupredoxin domain-containing protein [Photobacterium kishitanii]PSV14735.1 cupredoxin domain-containing protein [Photobacterium kishitanii]
MKKYLTLIILSFYLFSPISVYAAEKFTVHLQIKNGDLIPAVLEVPTKKIIRIKISNIGNQPAEFESTQLRKEKVLAPGASSVVVIAPLRQGTYTFFDDFHLDHPKGKIIAKESSQ